MTEGALVTADQDAPLATIQDLDPMYIDVTQSSAELLQLRKELASGSLEQRGSAPVTIVLEDGTRFPQTGTLAFSDVTVEPTTGSYLLRVQVPNPGQRVAARHVRPCAGRQRHPSAGAARAATGHRARSAG